MAGTAHQLDVLDLGGRCDCAWTCGCLLLFVLGQHAECEGEGGDCQRHEVIAWGKGLPFSLATCVLSPLIAVMQMSSHFHGKCDAAPAHAGEGDGEIRLSAVGGADGIGGGGSGGRDGGDGGGGGWEQEEEALQAQSTLRLLAAAFGLYS